MSDQVQLDLLRLDDHAVERAGERLWPHMRLPELKYHLRRLLVEHGQVVDAPPEWATVGTSNDDLAATEAYVLVGDDVVLPIRRLQVGWAAITVLTRGGLSHAQRERRNRKAKAKRSRKRGNSANIDRRFNKRTGKRREPVE